MKFITDNLNFFLRFRWIWNVYYLWIFFLTEDINLTKSQNTDIDTTGLFSTIN